jgi:hypothetical protein
MRSAGANIRYGGLGQRPEATARRKSKMGPFLEDPQYVWVDEIFLEFFTALVASGRATSGPGRIRSSLANLNRLDMLRDGSLSAGEPHSARQPQTPDGHP